MPLLKRRQILHALGGAIAVYALDHLASRPRAIAQRDPRKLALLIGINDYPAPIGDQRGCITDVEMQAQLLRDRYGFQPADILTLTDSDATREGILTAIEQHLIQQAQPGDIVVLHFSGQATRVPDPDCSGQDCLMGVLMPADIVVNDESPESSNIPAIENGITRTELDSLLSQLQTESLTVVLDTVFAGSFATADGFVKGVLLAGSMADQLAADSRFDDFYAGAFTYHLTQYLWQQPGDVSFAEAIEAIAEAISLESIPSIEQTPVAIAQPNSGFEQQPVYFMVPDTPSATPPDPENM